MDLDIQRNLILWINL